MSDFLKKELNKCTYCDFSNYDKETNTYHIPKYEKPRYNLHSCYLVKLASNIVNNKNSVLAVN